MNKREVMTEIRKTCGVRAIRAETENAMKKLDSTPGAYLRRAIEHVLDTRRYGSTYVHSGERGSGQIEGAPGIRFTVGGYGRSLQAGGHKYKVWANYVESGKPVPSKILRELRKNVEAEKETAKT